MLTKLAEDFRGFSLLFFKLKLPDSAFITFDMVFHSQIFIFYKSLNWLWGPPGLIFSWFRVLSREQSGRDVMLTAHLHLAPRLRVSGAIPLLPLYAFMALPGTALHRQLSAVLTGHGMTKAYLHRFHLSEEATCSCGNEYQSMDHLLFHCANTSAQREVLKQQIGTWPASTRRSSVRLLNQ